MNAITARPARRFTIHCTRWVAARKRIDGAELEPAASAAFRAAMDHVDLAWPVLRSLFVWADEQPDSARRMIDYGPLLELVQGELSEALGALAFTLARVVLEWPGWADVGPELLGDHTTEFLRYHTLVRMAVEVGTVPEPFRAAVRRVAEVLEPAGQRSWFSLMEHRVEAVIALEPAPPYRDGTWARRAMDILLYDLPPEQVDHARAFLIDEVERVYTSARHTPPQWLNVLRKDL